MRLLENINCEKGITLNSQLVDLLSILDDKNLTIEQQNQEIERYLSELKNREEKYLEASDKGDLEKNIYLLEDTISSIPGISSVYSEKLKNIYLSNISDLSVCNKEKMIQILGDNGFDSSIHEKIMIDLNTRDYTSKEGILLLTPDKVRSLYSHLFENGNKYDRITFDNVGKYSGYVCADGETFSTDKIDKMQKFCELHKMKSKINALMFYADFPKNYERSLNIRVSNGEITEQEKKELIQKSLYDYVRDIGTKYGDKVEAVDIFNELIYDPGMKEEGFDEPTDNYQYRTQGWHKYLNLEEICKMALIARKEMPNVTFTYNDMNWTNPEKRKQIIDVIKQIQMIEDKYRSEGIEIDGKNIKLGEDESLIDTIGFEAHLTTDVNLDEMEKALEEISEQLNLPIDITELDIACFGKDLAHEQEKQGVILEKIMQMINSSNAQINSLTIWSQSDECSFMNLKNKEKKWKVVYASLLDSDFQEKDLIRSKMIPMSITELMDMNEEQLANINFHATPIEATQGEEGIDRKGLNAKKGVNSNGVFGHEKTKKVFFSQGLNETLKMINKSIRLIMFSIEHRMDENGQKAMKELGIVENYKKVEDIFKNLPKESLSIEQITPEARTALYSIVKGAFESRTYYTLDLNGCNSWEYDLLNDEDKKKIDYKLDDYDEDKNSKDKNGVMAKYNMHTISGQGVSVDKVHRIVKKDGSFMSGFDTIMMLCQRYKELNPGKDFPTIIHQEGTREQWSDDNWLEGLYEQYKTLQINQEQPKTMFSESGKISPKQIGKDTVRAGTCKDEMSQLFYEMKDNMTKNTVQENELNQ